MGQLGNQMFIIATTIAYALREVTSYSIPLYSGKRNQFLNYFPHLHISEQGEFVGEIREKEFGVYNQLPHLDDLKGPGCLYRLRGYFQSEKYFKDYKKEVIKAFDLRTHVDSDCVSIHVRRGDYVQLQHKHPPIDKQYIFNAIELFPNSTEFLFFSDDLGWCKKNFQEDRFRFCEWTDPKESMALMASCDSHIISNSSFSWWGAWLNPDPNKVVIAPKRWFGERYQDKILQTRDIIPESWIKI